MRRGVLLPLCVVFLQLIGSANAEQQNRFSLDEIADRFPSEGFEHEIVFWKGIFVEYGERDILFHDKTDLRLVYRKLSLERGIKDDPAEAKRQRRRLKRTTKEIEGLLDEIGRWGADSGRLTPKHRQLIRVLEEQGVETTRSRLRQLSRNVRYQRGIKEKFLEGLIRSGRYLDRIESIFLSYGLPRELSLMPHVESSFAYGAYSKAGAVGMWQFMRSTGRRFLTINRYIDERRDPLAATDAAARHLKENYERLGTWPLAVTAYNHGVNGMRRAKKLHGDDFRTIVDKYQSRLFGFASKNFYPELLAAIEIARNYPHYFGEVELEKPAQFAVVPLEHAYRISDVVEIEGLSEELLRRYNPHLTRYVWRRSKTIPAGFDLRVPVGEGERVELALSKISPRRSRIVLAENGSVLYRVLPGDTLARIAVQFGTSVGKIQRLNNLLNPNVIQIGQTLVVAEAAPGAGAGGTRYRVRRGDSLARIAKRLGTTVRRLKALNGLSNPNRIYPGQILIVAPEP